MICTTRRFTLAATAMLVTLCGTAQALPPIMDRIPAGAPVVIVVPNIDSLEKDVNSVMTLVGAPGAGSMKASDMLESMGLSGVSTKGSMALVMLQLPDMEAGTEPSMIVLAQTDDYASLTKGLSAIKDGEVEKAVVDGEDVYMKSLSGGYIVAGADRDVIAKFEGKSGASDGHRKFYGDKADKLSDKADVAIFVDMVKLKPLMDQGFGMLEQQMADMAAVTGQDGNTEQMKWIKEQVIGNMTGSLFSLSIDSMGVSMDMAGSAKEGSPLAKAMDGNSNSNELLKKLPAGPYLFAFAMDTSSAAWKAFTKTMPQAETPPMAGLDSFMGASQQMSDVTTGTAMVMGVPPGGIMSGMMTRTTTYMATKSPEKIVALFRDEMPKMLDESKVGTMTYTANATEVNGTKIDSFETTINPDEGVPGMGQVMQFMFGMSGGPTAYVAPVDGGVVMTMSKSSEMMGAALKAAKGESTLASDRTLSAVGEKLPAGRTMEGYIGVKGILDTLLPMAAMMSGSPIKYEVPERLPPLAMGFAADKGQMHGTFYIPADVLKAGGDIAKAFMASQMQGGEEGDDGMGGAAPADQKKDAPKF